MEERKLRETDLYGPIRDYLLVQGYTVRSEVKGCDIVAVKGEDLIIIELKRSFCAALLLQATQRQRVGDSVYVALPRPDGRERSAQWRHILHLLRRLELGLILVSFAGEQPLVQIVFHPLPFARKRNSRGRRAILQEVGARSGEYNEGGSHRRGIVTAYRENAILIACCLDRHGPLTPQQLRSLGTGPKTQSILARNVHGWFERVDYGVYGLKPQGRGALANYPELVAQIRASLEGRPDDQAPCLPDAGGK